jgi:hypothetical protein
VDHHLERAKLESRVPSKALGWLWKGEGEGWGAVGSEGVVGGGAGVAAGV